MKAWLPALALSLLGCKDNGIPNLPVNPGPGGPGGGGPGVDAASDGTDGGPTLVGRVCLLADARDFTTCQLAGAGGLTVALGTATAITADDGSFTIAAVAGTNLVWRVSGGNIVPSLMPAGTLTQIPAIDATTYGTLQADNGVLLTTDQGSLMVRVASSNAALAGASVRSMPAPQYGPFYDGSNAQIWSQSATGAFGTAWLPGITPGATSLEVTPSGGSATAVGSVPVEAVTITYVFADIP